jgi:predicted tellurium resistance membrane protein TerC
MENLFTSTSLIAILALLVLHFLTSFDNVSFLTKATSSLTTSKRKTALLLGVLFSILLSLILLWAVMQFTFFNNTLFTVGERAVTPRFLLLFFGGLFIFLNSIILIFRLISGKINFNYAFSPQETISTVIVQIALFNFAFSLDSILVSIGLVGNISNAFYLIAISIVIYGLLMTFLADNLSNLLENSKTLRVVGYTIVALLALSLLLHSLGVSNMAIF